MAIAIRRQQGAVIDYVAPSDISAGDVIAIGELTAIAILDIASGNTGAPALEGVFEITCNTVNTASQGDNIYFDTVNDIVTTVTSNRWIGHLAKDLAATDDTAWVRLMQPGSDS
jgi:predicted RecA/RadA family phage recombinase